MKAIEASYGQTLIDIAIQEYGCYEGVMLLLEDNAPIGLTDNIVPGQQINVRNEVPELNERNQAIAAYFKANGIKVNSGWEAELEGYVQAGYVQAGYVN